MGAPNNEQNRNAMLQRHEVLIEVYREMLVVAYAKMKNKADALDIVQESWLKILIKWDTLKDPEKLLQWAKAIVLNTANTVIRRKITYEEILREHVVSIYNGIQSRPVDQELERNELLGIIAKLENDTRRMFLLKYYYDWKDQEIAEALGFPVGTIKARIHRGKKQLRVWLADPEDQKH